MQKRMLILFMLLLTAVTLAAQSRKLRPGFNLFSQEQDTQLGKESAVEVEKKMKVLDSPELQAYIATVGKKLTSSADAGEFPYSFKVVVNKSINAFALPGGPMYIHTGLIDAADHESQMVGVMAHEVSHVALRHGTNQASKQQMIQLPAMLVGQATGSGGLLGTLSQLGINLGANSVLLKFSRGAETEADLLGTCLMYAAGYNPTELASFFRKLEAEVGNQNKLVEMFMSSHPNPGNRCRRFRGKRRAFLLEPTMAKPGNSAACKRWSPELPENKNHQIVFFYSEPLDPGNHLPCPYSLATAIHQSVSPPAFSTVPK